MLKECKENYDESKKKGRKESVWDAYIKNIGMTQYKTMRWRDGDLFNTYVEDAKAVADMEKRQEENAQMIANSQEVNNEFETKIQNLFVGGDGAGITRGLAQAGANGVKIARVISSRK